jgi:hypothetical protein
MNEGEGAISPRATRCDVRGGPGLSGAARAMGYGLVSRASRVQLRCSLLRAQTERLATSGLRPGGIYLLWRRSPHMHDSHCTTYPMAPLAASLAGW